MNITEDYVSFEVAKLLKEKGFNWPCRVLYSYIGEFNNDVCNRDVDWNSISPSGDISAPTHQMAMAWLRQNHKINIVIMPAVADDDGDGGCLYNYIIFKLTETIRQSKYLYEKYSMACDDALKYVLENLI